jgi:hypothetical protein
MTYGRMVTMLVDSEASSLEIKASLSAAWQAAVSGKADLAGEYKRTLQRSSVTAVVIGGSSGVAGEVINDPANNLLGWIKSQLKITADLPVTPIQYTVRYLAPPQNLVRVSRTTTWSRSWTPTYTADARSPGPVRLAKAPGAARSIPGSG